MEKVFRQLLLRTQTPESRNTSTTVQMLPVSLPTTDPILYDSLMSQDWDKAIYLIKMNPSLASYQHRGGLTPLHLACLRGSSPLCVIQHLVEAYPHAVNIRTIHKLQDTPLHMQSRNCQRTSSKIKALLPYADTTIVNRLGHTALHTACGTNASIDVLEAFIAKDESLLNVVDVNGQTPLTSLWEGFLGSVPGHLRVHRILRGDTDGIGGTMQRLWDKVQLLVLRQRIHPHELGHAMIQLNVPSKMVLLGLRLDPHLACRCDSDGNCLIHTMLLCRFPFHQEIVDLVATSERLVTCNTQGDTILSLAIKNQMVEYIPPSIHVAPTLLTLQDNDTGLYPFQLAAAYDCSLTLIFSLLIQQPEPIQY